MSYFDEMITDVTTMAVTGHVHPDGDCIGSCLAAYNYAAEHYPGVRVSVFLEEPPDKFRYLKNIDCICSDFSRIHSFDLCLCLDCSDKKRFGGAVKYLEGAKKTVCVDHHVTNGGFADYNIIRPDASSTCEVLYGLLEEDSISRPVAECLYTGLIHDTGVFKYGCTSEKTMMIAGKLMAAGIDFPSIIDNSFFRKTYVQNKMLGQALLNSVTALDGRLIYSVLSKEELMACGAVSADLDGIIDQLRVTKGVECAMFLYETGDGEYKVSLRSASNLDVSKVALHFGGGGHVKAAGCTVAGKVPDILHDVTAVLREFMSGLGEE